MLIGTRMTLVDVCIARVVRVFALVESDAHRQDACSTEGIARSFPHQLDSNSLSGGARRLGGRSRSQNGCALSIGGACILLGADSMGIGGR